MLAEVEEDYGDLFDSGGARLSDYRTERLLLGYLIHRPASIAEAVEMVRSNDFFNPFHRRVYEALERAFTSGEEIGAGSLVQALGGDPKAILFDDVTTGGYIAGLVADADLSIDLAEHAEIVAACSERRAIGSADDVDLGTLPVHSRFGGQRWEDIGRASSGNSYPWAVEDIIPMGEITLAFGDSGTGKSFDNFAMGMCIARGNKFNNLNVESGLVVYVAAEAGKGFGKRKIAYAMHHQLDDDPLPFYLMTKRPDFFGNETDIDNLIAEIRALKRAYRERLVLITLDTLSALAPGMNENASQDVSRVRAKLVRLSEAFPEAAIILIHHKPKGGSTPRGHGSLTADFETTIEYETVVGRVSNDGLPIHRATVRKQREGKSGISWEFTLPRIEVGRNKWGNPETSCVVVPFEGGRAVKPNGFRANKTELSFLEALFEALNEKGVLPPSGLPASITRATPLVEVRAKMRERYIQSEEDSSKADNRFRQAFKRAGDALKAGKVIGYRDPLVWYSGKPVHGLTATLTPVQLDE